MNTMRSQRGMTLLGLVMGLALVGFFLFIGMKLFPVYNEYRSVVSVLNNLQNQPGLANAAPTRIRELIARGFTIDYVDNVKAADVKIETKPVPRLVLDYEVRKPLMYNLDFVAKFSHTVELK